VADNKYKVGQGVTLEFDLTVNGAPQTDTIDVVVTKPDGSVINPTATQSPTGTFKATFTADQAGLWFYSADTNTNIAVGAGSFVVEALIPTVRSDALTDLLSAREFVLQDSTDSSQDPRLARLINAYSRSIYKFTRREWRPQTNAATRSFTYDGSGVLELANPDSDLRAVTAVVLYTDLPTGSRQTLTPPSGSVQGDWRLGPIGGTPEGTYLRLEFTSLLNRPFNTAGFPGYGPCELDYKVDVTGNWGIASTLAGVPDDVQLACLVAIADAYRNPEGFASRVIGPLQLTEEAAAPAGESFSARNLPVEAQELLEPYRARTIQMI